MKKISLSNRTIVGIEEAHLVAEEEWNANKHIYEDWLELILDPMYGKAKEILGIHTTTQGPPSVEISITNTNGELRVYVVMIKDDIRIPTPAEVIHFRVIDKSGEIITSCIIEGMRQAAHIIMSKMRECTFCKNRIEHPRCKHQCEFVEREDLWN